jgi:hypothetical protein
VQRIFTPLSCRVKALVRGDLFASAPSWPRPTCHRRCPPDHWEIASRSRAGWHPDSATWGPDGFQGDRLERARANWRQGEQACVAKGRTPGRGVLRSGRRSRDPLRITWDCEGYNKTSQRLLDKQCESRKQTSLPAGRFSKSAS